MAKIILQKHTKKNSYKIYSVDEKVFVRIDEKWGKTSKILSGRITKSWKDVTYNVKYKLSTSDSFSSEIFWVENIFHSHKIRTVKVSRYWKKERKFESNYLSSICSVLQSDGWWKLPILSSVQFIDEIRILLISTSPYGQGCILPRKQRFRQRNSIGTFLKFSLRSVRSKNEYWRNK